MVGKKCVCDAMARHVVPMSRNPNRQNLDLMMTRCYCVCIKKDKCLCGKNYKEIKTIISALKHAHQVKIIMQQKLKRSLNDIKQNFHVYHTEMQFQHRFLQFYIGHGIGIMQCDTGC